MVAGWRAPRSGLPSIGLVLTAAIAGVSCCSATAEAQQRRVRMRYQVPQGCPDASEFSAQLAERGRGLSVEPADGGDVDVDVAVRADGQLYRGSVAVVTRDGPIPRGIDGESCADLVTALALSAAMLLDDATNATAGAPPESGTQLRQPTPPRIAEQTPSVAVHWSAGARFELSLLLTSGLALGPGVYAGISWDRASVVSPSLRLAASYAVASVDETVRGSADLGWFVAGISGCPLRLGDETVGIRPCVGVGGGALHGVGTTDAPTSDTALWAESTAGARAHVVLFRHLVLELEADAVVPLTRYRFLLERPEEELARIRPAGARIAVGAGGIF